MREINNDTSRVKIQATPFDGGKVIHSLLKARPRGEVMFIGCAIETLRDEAPLHAASTPPVEAVLAAGYGKPHPFALNGEQ